MPAWEVAPAAALLRSLPVMANAKIKYEELTTAQRRSMAIRLVLRSLVVAILLLINR